MQPSNARSPSPSGSAASRTDIAAGGILVLIALSFLAQAMRLEAGTLGNPGPGMLPAILSAALVLCGVGLVVVGFIGKGPAADHFRMAWRGPIMVGAAILFFSAAIEGVQAGGLVVPQLGLAIVGPVTVILAGCGAAEADLRDLGAIGFGLTAFCLALFDDLLGMDIPVVPGPVEPALIEALGVGNTLRAAYLTCAAAAILIAASRRRARAGSPGRSDG